MKDVEIFAACLKDLLLENDTVTVPGLGSFITRLMPASFSDRGRTINPPYRKLSFRSSEQGDGQLFVNRLAALLPEGSDAAGWLQSFVKVFREELEKTKRVDLASLGAMRATAQNDYFFVASDDLDIYPEGLGLEAVTIKSSQTVEEDSRTDSELEEDNLPEPEGEPAAEPEPEPSPEPASEPAAVQGAEPEPKADPEPVPAAEPATAHGPETQPAPQPALRPAQAVPTPASPAPAAVDNAEKPRRKLKWWAVVLTVLAAILLFLILSVIFKDILPWGSAVDNFMNHLLYSEEELRIINS